MFCVDFTIQSYLLKSHNTAPYPTKYPMLADDGHLSTTTPQTPPPPRKSRCDRTLERHNSPRGKQPGTSGRAEHFSILKSTCSLVAVLVCWWWWRCKTMHVFGRVVPGHYYIFLEFSGKRGDFGRPPPGRSNFQLWLPKTKTFPRRRPAIHLASKSRIFFCFIP